MQLLVPRRYFTLKQCCSVSSLLLFKRLFVEHEVLQLLIIPPPHPTLITSQSQSEMIAPVVTFVHDSMKVLLLSPSQEAVEIAAQVLHRCAISVDEEAFLGHVWESWMQDHLAEAIRGCGAQSSRSLVTLMMTYEKFGAIRQVNQNLSETLLSSTSHVPADVTDVWASNYRVVGTVLGNVNVHRLPEILSRAEKQCSQAGFLSLLIGATQHKD